MHILNFISTDKLFFNKYLSIYTGKAVFKICLCFSWMPTLGIVRLTFFFLLLSGHTHNMQKFWGLGSNLHYSCNLSHSSDHSRSLTLIHFAIWPLHNRFLRNKGVK